MYQNYEGSEGISEGDVEDKITENIRMYHNGQTEHIYHFRNGKKYGSQEEFYPNGQCRSKYFYDELGQEHGEWYQWYSNGQVRLYAQYEHGQLMKKMENNLKK